MITESENIILPSHIAFIMDGNGRWAQKRGLPRQQGHVKGVLATEKIIDWLCDRRIRAATFYTFSTENWARPQAEIDTIMRLLSEYLDKLYKKYLKENSKYSDVEFRFTGDISAFSPEIVSKIERIHNLDKTQKNIKTTVNIAVNYGGRQEIVNAVNRFIADNPGKPITAEDITSNTYFGNLPDPDLIIRTAGEHRLSNFLTWESVYSEYYSTEVLWPDFGVEDLLTAVGAYNLRQRKFGAVVK